MSLVSSNMTSYVVLLKKKMMFILLQLVRLDTVSVQLKPTEYISKQTVRMIYVKDLSSNFFFCRLSPSAAGSSPLHPSPAPGVCSHVAGGAEGERAGLRDGGGVCQHCVRNCAWTPECRSEGAAPPGTQSAGRSEERYGFIVKQRALYLSGWIKGVIITTTALKLHVKLNYCLSDVRG